AVVARQMAVGRIAGGRQRVVPAVVFVSAFLVGAYREKGQFLRAAGLLEAGDVFIGLHRFFGERDAAYVERIASVIAGRAVWRGVERDRMLARGFGELVRERRGSGGADGLLLDLCGFGRGRGVAVGDLAVGTDGFVKLGVGSGGKQQGQQQQ